MYSISSQISACIISRLKNDGLFLSFCHHVIEMIDDNVMFIKNVSVVHLLVKHKLDKIKNIDIFYIDI